MTANMSRRNLLKAGGGVALAGVLLPGCSALSTDPEKKTSTGTSGAAAGSAKESPMLAEQVKAGKLPSLEKRLPAKPMVIKPLSEAGVYGGTMQRGQTDPGRNDMDYPGWAGLAEWSPTTPPEPQPALAESWDVEQGGKVFVFHLRQGVKWSDGKDFTTDDLMFVYQYFWDNGALDGFPGWLMPGEAKAKWTAPDKYTLRMEFAAPNGLLLKNLCFIGSAGALLQPAHYMKQFHPKFADAAKLKALMKQEKQSTWETLYTAMRDKWKNPALPVLGAWRLTKPMLGGNSASGERNPYYWKTDPDGRQLPYIDKLAFTSLDAETLGLRAANGEIDLAGSELGFQVAPVLIKNAESKPFTMLRWKPDGMFNVVYLNLSHPDQVLRTLFQNIDFRAGASHAINRQEINDALLAGQGRIAHPCAQPGDPYYVEGMGQRFIEFDEAKANQLLDKAGLTRKGSDGFRLRPDGKPLNITCITFNVGVGVPMVDVLEFVKRHWAKVGLRITIKSISDKLWADQIPQGRYDAVGYPPAGYLWDIDPLWYVPTANVTYWAPNYGAWYVDKKDKYAMEPAGEIRQTQVLFDKLRQEVDDAKRITIGQEILKLHDKNVWMIGTVQPPFSPVVVADDLGNMRTDGIASWRTHYDGAANLSQLYFKNPDQHS